jgi:hypothetical protein
VRLYLIVNGESTLAASTLKASKVFGSMRKSHIYANRITVFGVSKCQITREPYSMAILKENDPGHAYIVSYHGNGALARYRSTQKVNAIRFR